MVRGWPFGRRPGGGERMRGEPIDVRGGGLFERSLRSISYCEMRRTRHLQFRALILVWRKVHGVRNSIVREDCQQWSNAGACLLQDVAVEAPGGQTRPSLGRYALGLCPSLPLLSPAFPQSLLRDLILRVFAYWRIASPAHCMCVRVTW